jgi:glyoxylase-like metal-dependent hydrolase (beta-lactamase superfamily II)
MPEPGTHRLGGAGVDEGQPLPGVDRVGVDGGADRPARQTLVDTGTAQAMGPGLGHMARNLAAAGLAPDQVDQVVLTHLHPDHANGLIAPGGAAFFPNAEVVVAEAELAFWGNDAIMAQAPAEARPFFAMARAAVAPYRAANRLRAIAPGADLGQGVSTVAAAGHTPGHMMVRVASGAAQLLIWGDMVHVAPFQIARPEWTIGFDIDQAEAARTRARVFDMVATDRIAVAGMHMPFPGLGTLLRDAGGFRFAPMTWNTF